ncbi:dihydrolipoyllysine-residue acetyltransferase [Halomonas cibimaris]|uniref:Acetyltransferase component of pyruvate dehydrogenase complex n=1 Tax=Halomonas cibimaris TaxID=657012 RepID=A0ABP7LQN0_9GAMM
MSSENIKVPDIGGDDVEIIEIAVSEGDVIEAEDALITLESDKASMDVPSPKAGKVLKVLVKEGDTVSEGDDIVELEVEGGEDAGDDQAEQAPAKKEASAQKEAPKQEDAPKEDAAPTKKAAGGKQTVDVTVPDIGDSAEIIEIAVSVGDEIDAEDALITLESDKASMDVPSPHTGKLVELSVKVGDSVSEGDVIGQMEVEGEGGDAAEDASQDTSADDSASAASQSEPEAADEDEDDGDDGEPARQEIRVPDIGDSAEIIEIAVSAGDDIEEEDALITLESDKASMDVPSPYKGKLVEVSVKVGDSVSEGDVIGIVEVAGAKKKPAPKKQTEQKQSEQKSAPEKQAAQKPASGADKPAAAPSAAPAKDGKRVHAGPAVRMLAREFGVDLAQVPPTGPKDRVLKEDVQAFVKKALSGQAPATAGEQAPAAGGSGIPPIPDQDFSQFGEVEEKPMGRLMKMGATNLHRSWVNLPHVTQFDEADITELEAFRKSMKAEAEAQGAKLTPLPFLVKACAFALKQFPQFNVSLKSDGETVVWKKYVHIGIAVDTPDGLMVPVLRDADQKSLLEIAREMAELGKKAQSKKLKREDMSGGCFTISSLGSIGGTAFTPIVNAPEVAILGVSKAQTKPVWDGAEFQPRLMMPLSLSYDHRAVNGADAARFTVFLSTVLTDIRRLLL